MKNKFGGAAIIAGIATLVNTLLSSVLNSILLPTLIYDLDYDGIMYTIAIINALEIFVAMLIGIKIYSVIVKKKVPKAKIVIISILSGILVAATNFLGLLQYIGIILIFAILFLLALLITKTNSNESEEEKVNNQNESTGKKNYPIANEEMSAKAQFAYNEKLTSIKETAINVDEIVEAKLFAQAVELQLLKAPASAKFCSLEEMTVTSNENIYIVSGYVDSQNSYGAIVRTPFKVTVFKENGTWKNADKYINMSASIGAQVISNTIVYWIIGIILSLASFAFFYFIISSQF